MSLSKERLGEIAMLTLQFKTEQDGINLKPSEIKRMIFNSAKKLGIKPDEAAGLFKIIVGEAYKKVVAILDEMMSKIVIS